ncbi:MAG: DnaD domain protein [Clostridia bacterium]|nr:DnaD domain protein [Clostridia bacterium]
MAEPVTLDAQTVRRLLAAKNGSAALLYLYLAAGEPFEQAQAALALTKSDFEMARATLQQMGLWRQTEIRHLPPSEAPRYTEEDLTRELSGNPEFPAMVGEAQRRLGRILSNEELKILLSVYRYLGLAPEVISVLINYCIQRQQAQGSSRMPSIRTIEKEAYRWADNGVDTMEQASAFMQSQLRRAAGVEHIQQLFGLADRRLSVGEQRYISDWLDWGFSDDAIRMAYDKTCTNTGGLKWAYLNSILKSWHEQDLHTPAQIEAGDRAPGSARTRKKPGYNAAQHNEPLSELDQDTINRMLHDEEI